VSLTSSCARFSVLLWHCISSSTSPAAPHTHTHLLTKLLHTHTHTYIHTYIHTRTDVLVLSGELKTLIQLPLESAHFPTATLTHSLTRSPTDGTSAGGTIVGGERASAVTPSSPTHCQSLTHSVVVLSVYVVCVGSLSDILVSE
jgi:hypothetical protein